MINWLKGILTKSANVTMDIKTRPTKSGRYRCRNCAYFLRIDDDSGECRSHPPNVIAQSNRPLGFWAIVRPGDYCGKFSMSRKRRQELGA